MHWITGLPQIAAGSFVSDLWQGSILAVGVWLCLRLLPRATAAIRFAVWSAVFVILAARPFLQAYVSHTSQALPAHAALLQIDIRWSLAIAGVWVLVSLVRLARLAASGLQLHGIWKRAIPITAGHGLEASPGKAGWRTAQLCTSRDVDSPSVIGFFSPKILIPEVLLERLTPQEMQQIVLHEMGHLRRGDDWINLAQKLGLVLFPLNPVLMWIERRLCFERELACDESVLLYTRAPKAYATCLTSLAERRLDRRAVSLSLGAWERQSELARRIHSILRRGEGMGRTQARVALGVMVVALLGGATELARCPRIVSFSAPGFGASAPLVQSASSTLPAMLPAPAYQPVVARTMTRTIAPAHETLLKASMPSYASVPSSYTRSDYAPSNNARSPNNAAQAAVPLVAHRRPRRAHMPVLRRTKQRRAQVQQWVVLTSSWGQPGGTAGVSRMLLTVSGERGFVASYSYAAVPTDVGWLVIQL